MTRPTGQVLFADILAEPGDDGLRRIYADWLEENGDPGRAEFIRTQLELAGLPGWDQRTLSLSWREQELFDAHLRRWCDEVPASAGWTWRRMERGFFGEVQVRDAEAFRKHAAELAAVAPVTAVWVRDQSGRFPTIQGMPRLRRLWLTFHLDAHFHLAQLAACDFWESLEELSLMAGPSQLAEMNSLPPPPRLRRLKLHTREFSRDTAVAFMESPWFAALEELDLNGGAGVWPEGEGFPRLLAESPRAGKLRDLSLDLEMHTLGKEPLRHLLDSRHLKELRELKLGYMYGRGLGAPEKPRTGPSRLEALSLRNTRLPADELQQLFANPRMQGLASLSLQGDEVAPEALKALAGSRIPRSLRRLDLGRRVSGAGMQELARSDWPRLHTLLLDQAGVRDEGFAAVADSGHFRHLEVLELAFNKLTSASAERIAGGAFPNLLELHAAGNEIKPEGIQALASSAHLGSLRLLSLPSNPIQKAGFTALGRANWPQLRVLSLGRCSVRDNALAGLAGGGGLPSLTRLRVDGNRIGLAGLTALLASPLAGRLTDLDLHFNPFGEGMWAALTKRTTQPGVLPRLLCLRLNVLPEDGPAASLERGVKGFLGSPLRGQLVALTLDDRRPGVYHHLVTHLGEHDALSHLGAETVLG